MKYVWKGHGEDSELGNVSARQAALNRGYRGGSPTAVQA